MSLATAQKTFACPPVYNNNDSDNQQTIEKKADHPASDWNVGIDEPQGNLGEETVIRIDDDELSDHEQPPQANNTALSAADNMTQSLPENIRPRFMCSKEQRDRIWDKGFFISFAVLVGLGIYSLGRTTNLSSSAVGGALLATCALTTTFACALKIADLFDPELSVPLTPTSSHV